MAIAFIVIAVVAGVAIAGVATIYVAVTRGLGRLFDWGRRQQLPEMAASALGTLKSSPTVKQLTGGSGTYTYLEPETAPAWQIQLMLRGRKSDPVLGRHASDLSSSLDKVDFYEHAFESILESEFGSTSLTWARFKAPIDEAIRDVLATAARAANRMQMFDTEEYQRLSAFGADPGSADAENLSVMMSTVADVSKMRDTDVRLIAGLERLYAALSSLPAERADDECQELLDDLRRLSGEAALYR